MGSPLVGTREALASVADGLARPPPISSSGAACMAVSGTTGPAGNVLKIRPPLVFQPVHADLLVETLGDVLGELSGALTAPYSDWR